MSKNQDLYYFIDRCIEEIQQKQNLTIDHQWRQRDFEYLIEEIYESTKVQISLSTIKRIWKHEHSYQPRPSTLDALAQYLGHKNWSAYISRDKEASLPESKVEKAKKRSKIGIISSVFFLIVISAVIINQYRSKEERLIRPSYPESIDEIEFSHTKTLDNGVPNSVIFHYDLKGFETEQAAIQLSWNRLERFPINSHGSIRTLMYYYPGWHEAKLLIGDSIIKRDYVSVGTDGWVSLLRYKTIDVVPIYIENTIKNGEIYANTELLFESKVDTTADNYFVSHFNVQDFDIDGDHFSFKTSIKNPAVGGKASCQYSSFYIYTEHSGIYVTIGDKGCSSTFSVSVSDKVVLGKDNDLSALGADLSEWQDIEMKIVNNQLEIFMNELSVFKTFYTEPLGEVKAWHYYFNGSGAVDYLRIYDENQQPVFVDEFDN